MIPVLGQSLYFPPATKSSPRGIVAVGGDLSPERLLLAYKNGIFPWYNENDPIIWWSLDPRMILFPEKLKISKSMRPYINQERFQVSYNRNFAGVISACQRIARKGQWGTWITEEMKEAYIRMHELGYAMSTEVWDGELLVGGLYGIRIGKLYCGESMFSIRTNASKFGFIKTVDYLKGAGVELVDCQQESAHLHSLGAECVSREHFLAMIKPLVHQE